MKRSIISFFKSNFLYRAYMFILLPVLFLLLFTIFSSVLYTGNQKNLLQESYASQLSSAYNRIEDSLQSIVKMVRLLSENSEFMRTINGITPTAPEENIWVSSVLLRKIKDNSPMIDSIVIVNRDTKTVYGTSGTVAQIGRAHV